MSELTIYELNRQRIDKRIREGLALMRANYELIPVDVGEFEQLHIRGMDYVIQQYQVKELGNLLIMVCRDSEIMQMDSFVLTPYFKNLPLFSTDYMYMKERRCFLNEIYSLGTVQDNLYTKYMNAFRETKGKYHDLQDMPVESCWYDSMRPVCTAKVTDPVNDERIVELFLENLRTYIAMEKETPRLSEHEYLAKWKETKMYTDGLVDKGGVSTDVFKAEMGADKVKEFFNYVFFAPLHYQKEIDHLIYN